MIACILYFAISTPSAPTSSLQSLFTMPPRNSLSVGYRPSLLLKSNLPLWAEWFLIGTLQDNVPFLLDLVSFQTFVFRRDHSLIRVLSLLKYHVFYALSILQASFPDLSTLFECAHIPFSFKWKSRGPDPRFGSPHCCPFVLRMFVTIRGSLEACASRQRWSYC